MRTLVKWSGVLLLVMVNVTSPGPREALGGDWYVTGGAGLNHLDVPWGEAEFGPHALVSGGHRFNRNFALELESGYIRADFSSETRRAGFVNQIPLVVNGVYSFANHSRIEPFAGVGVGAMFIGHSDDWGGDVCLAFKGGARYGIDGNVSIGADYTYYMLGAMTLLISAFGEELDPVGNDTFNLTLRWMF